MAFVCDLFDGWPFDRKSQENLLNMETLLVLIMNILLYYHT